MRHCNRTSLDHRGNRWGYRPAPLLPKSLRKFWGSEQLPSWACVELKLPIGSTIRYLDASIWENIEAISERLRHYVLFLLKTRAKEIRSLRCVSTAWPVGLQSEDIVWSVRTKNCLGKIGLLKKGAALTQVTFGELFRIEGMGVTTILDYCAALEGAIELSDQSAIELSTTESMGWVDELASLMEERWTSQVSRADPRFVDCLSVPYGTLRDNVEQILVEPDGLPSATMVPAILSSIPKCRERVREIETLSLSGALINFLQSLSRFRGARLDAIAVRLGWYGETPATLEEAGTILGVTRERIRQIQSKVLKKIPKHEVFMPQLDSALSLLEQNCPTLLADASDLFAHYGVANGRFDVRSILKAAKLLHKNTTLEIRETRKGDMVIAKPNAKALRSSYKIARRLAGQSGISNVYQVLDQLDSQGMAIEEKSLRRILSANDDLAFLGDDWFWATDIPSARNRLRNTVRKILCVASPQSIVSVRDGVRRAYRWRRATNRNYETLTVPPVSILREFFKQYPEFSITDDHVRPFMPLNYIEELGATDRVMVEVLRSSPAGVLDRESFANECFRRGMNENTFSIYSTYSCVIEHLGVNLWKLRGTQVDPAAVEALRLANHLRPREKRVLQHGWTPDGKLWIAARVPRIGKNSMVVGCPSAIQRFLLNREFNCVSKPRKQPCGTVSISENGSSYGYGVFIRKYGLDENDVVLAEFDLSTNVVELSVASDDIIDDASDVS